MAETVLVKADLTPEMISAGRILLTGLDSQGLVFDAAFWLLDEDSVKWHLVLSNRSVRKDGSLALYHKVNKALEKLRLQNVMWIGDITIVDHRVPIVQSLRSVLGTAASVDGARLDNATVGGSQVPGCVLYRLSGRQRLLPRRPDPKGGMARSASPA